jgi:CRP-like cAMP-binding protein
MPLGFPSSGDRGHATPVEALFGRHVRPLRAGSTLLLEGDRNDTIFCVMTGWLSLSKSLCDGQVQIIDFAMPIDIIDPAAADGTTSCVTVEALTDGAVAAIPHASWVRLTEDWPEARHVMRSMDAARAARRAERMLRLGKGTAEMRIAYALLELCIRLDRVPNMPSNDFHVPLTQQQLGDYVGLSSVHVCRTMRRMARNGILTMKNHMDIRILEPEALAELAGIMREDLRRCILPF